jgi:rSAM/selenodomain-associated transferase 1
MSSAVSAKKDILVIMAKEPKPGQVKTRISPEISSSSAAVIYHHFLLDRLEEMGKIKGVDLAIAYSPLTALETFTDLAGGKFSLFPQIEGNLGQRMNAIICQKKNIGYHTICIIGSDSPDLPKSLVLDSFKIHAEKRADIVLGPSTDGGYYLISMQTPHPEIFTDIPWSTNRVLSATLKKTKELGLRTKLLREWDDIDTYQDLAAFYQRYDSVKSDGSTPGSKTLSFLSEIKNFP